MKNVPRLLKPESERNLDNELFGYSLFTDNPEPLRSYNRCITIMNMVENGHDDNAKEYFSQFKGNETSAIMLMAMSIKRHGIEDVKKKVINNIDWNNAEEVTAS